MAGREEETRQRGQMEGDGEGGGWVGAGSNADKRRGGGKNMEMKESLHL